MKQKNYSNPVDSDKGAERTFRITSGRINIGDPSEYRAKLEEQGTWALPALNGLWDTFVIRACEVTIDNIPFYAVKAVHQAHVQRTDWVRTGKRIHIEFFSVAIYDACLYPSEEQDEGDVLEALGDEAANATATEWGWSVYCQAGVAYTAGDKMKYAYYPVYGLYDGDNLVGVKILFVQEPEDIEDWLPTTICSNPAVMNAALPSSGEPDQGTEEAVCQLADVS